MIHLVSSFCDWV